MRRKLNLLAVVIAIVAIIVLTQNVMTNANDCDSNPILDGDGVVVLPCDVHY